MESCAVICEFNPFHDGHAHLLRRAKEQTGAHVVCLMSGNVVQRGSFALLPRHLRAACAIDGGADAVFELPASCVLNNAAGFAKAGVSMAAALGCRYLAFGSECGDLSLLQQAADATLSPAYEEALKDCLARGLSFATASREAMAACFPALGEVLACPNNLLGIEYLKAIRELKLPLLALTFPREGNGYTDTQTVEGRFPSSSSLRTLLAQEPTHPLLPSAVREACEQGLCPSDGEKVASAVLTLLRRLSPEEMALCADVSEGLEYRLLKAAGECRTLKAFFETCATRRYPPARLRRIVMNATLGCTAQDNATPPLYARLLAAKRSAVSLWENASIPVVVKPARAELSSRAARQFSLNTAACDLFAFTLPDPEALKADMALSPLIF
ncbi:MAG: nucleotidyltransferase family protein [Clostridia bacterium]|nr:nucleotidyltransferase family protein [Clostridia bacterium]